MADEGDRAESSRTKVAPSFSSFRPVVASPPIIAPGGHVRQTETDAQPRSRTLPPSFSSFDPAAEEDKARRHGKGKAVERAERPSRRRDNGGNDAVRYSSHDYRSRHHTSSRPVKERREGESRSHKRSRSSSREGERGTTRQRHSSGGRREREERKQSHRHRSRSRDRARHPLSPTSTSSRSPSTSSLTRSAISADATVFYVDNRGDELNIRYGALDRYKVPRYHRLGQGRVVGLDDGMRITKETSKTGNGLEVVKGGKRVFRYVDPKERWRAHSTAVRRVRLDKRAAHTRSSSPAQDFIALPTTSRSRQRMEHEEGQEYRSIAGMVRPGELVSDTESDGEKSEEEEGESWDEILRQRNRDLDRRLKEDPGDVQAWLELARLQDEIIDVSFSEDSGGDRLAADKGGKAAIKAAKRTTTEGARARRAVKRRAVAEIKVDVFTRALSAHPSNANSPVLVLARLREASSSGLWDASKLNEEWDRALDEHPEIVELWIEWVGWKQTDWSTFAVDAVVATFADAIGKLRDRAGAEQWASPSRETLEENMIYLLVRCALMLKEAGYVERAIALMQGVIELNFFRPRALLAPYVPDSGPDARLEEDRKWREALLESLERFWNAERPRVGEQGSKGWAAWEEGGDGDSASRDATSQATIKPGEEVAEVSYSNPFERWAASERTRSTTSFLPSSANDIDDETDDPYRTVLFTDIAPLLFPLHGYYPRLHLVYALLAFLNLPFTPPEMPTTTPFTTDAFLQSSMAYNQQVSRRFWSARDEGGKSWDIIDGEPMERERKSGMEAPWECPIKGWPTAVDTLIASKSPTPWFSDVTRDDLATVNVPFARNVFEQLRPFIQEPFFDLSYLSFEASVGSKGAVKLAKRLLKTSRQDLLLWDAYARLERQAGKLQEARTVYATALSMSRQFSEEKRADEPALWRAWAEMEWEEGRESSARAILVAASGVDDAGSYDDLLSDNPAQPSAVQLLKARQRFQSRLAGLTSQATSYSLSRHAGHVVFCSALLEYLTNGLPAACDVYETRLRSLSTLEIPAGIETEEAFMAYVKLLFRHTTSLQPVSFRPALLRDVLERAIVLFPDNMAFLSLFAFNELKTKIQGRVRRVLEERVLARTKAQEMDTSGGDGRRKGASSRTWLFAIYAELHLDQYRFNDCAVRSLFERAVEERRVQSSVEVWKLYIDFETRQGHLTRAKSLIYRAIRECPWCKELYILPFSPPLLGTFTSSELRSLHDMMGEKELRVHVDLEPLLEGWEEETSSGAEETDEDREAGEGAEDSEGEREFRERQRLLPY